MTDKTQFGFDRAVVELKAGIRVTRAGWTAKGLYVGVNPASDRLDQRYLYLRTGGQNVVWTPSQTDVLAEDWEVVG
jgi:hypothetical protein